MLENIRELQQASEIIVLILK